MKISLRVQVMILLLGLVTTTVSGLGYNSYRNRKFSAREMCTRVLQENSVRIEEQINELLLTAERQGDLNLRLINSGQFRVDNFAPLAGYWLEVMRSHPKLTRISLGLEADGQWFYVRRTSDGQLVVGELRKNPSTGKLGLSAYRPAAYPRGKPFYANPDVGVEDPRRRAWYVAARAARRQTWSETYVFFGAEGYADAPGVSCATPIFRPDGSLVGVMTTSIELKELCEFLKTLTIDRSGYAFVVENRPDGTRHVIAHPNADILLHVVKGEGDARVSELVPTDQLADPRVRAFLEQCPPGTGPSGNRQMNQLRFSVGGVPFLGSDQILAGEKAPSWSICTLVPEAEVLSDVQRNNRITVLIGLAIFSVAVVASLGMARQIARPLEHLARETEAIGQLHVEPRPVAHSIVEEVDRLALGMEAMKTSLRSFQKYVPSDLVRALLTTGREASLGGECKTVTVSFSDIVDFTGISEKLSPEELVEHLREYLNALSQDILAAGGTVDKYIGDAIMAFWGAPGANPQHALAACTAALRSQARLQGLRAEWQAKGKPPFAARFGLNTGEVVVGNIGSENRFNYTVIGDAVNLASRLEGLNKYYGTDILISQSTFREVQPAVVARPLDWVSVKGRTEAVLVYELLGLRGEVNRSDEELADLYSQALARYRDQAWPDAIRLFEQILRLRSDDPPARQMILRCRDYRAQPPGASWDGVHRMASK